MSFPLRCLQRSLDVGMNEVLGKPITRDAVEKIIRKILLQE